MSSRPLTLRSRLTLAAVAAAIVAVTALVAVFNLVLDARLRANTDNLLRERSAAVLRGLGSVDGRLAVIEAPDAAAPDSRTWILGPRRALEQPARVSTPEARAVAALAAGGRGFTTLDAVDTRLLATPVREGNRRIGTVVVASSLAAYHSAASAALLWSAVMGALIVAATALLARWLVGYSLAPVARMTERAASWDEQDPSRRFYLEEPRDELGRLAAVFDQLLRRLALSLRRERELTAEVSHELRTPLAKILGEAELAAAPHREPEDRRSAITRIQRHATELQRVLEALLASARAGTSSAGESCSACQAARQAAAAAGPAITAAGKTLDVRCHGSFRVAAGPELLERALAPLLENAARYAKRQIVLEVLPSADKAVFEVADDGEGIPAGDRARIFDAGFRGRDTADGHSGSGLGLALVRRLSSAAGGEVEAIESAEGTRLILRMPLA